MYTKEPLILDSIRSVCHPQQKQSDQRPQPTVQCRGTLAKSSLQRRPEVCQGVTNVLLNKEWGQIGIQIFFGFVDGVRSSKAQQAQASKSINTKEYFKRKNGFAISVASSHIRLGKLGSEAFLAKSQGLLGDLYGLLRYPRTQPKMPHILICLAQCMVCMIVQKILFLLYRLEQFIS